MHMCVLLSAHLLSANVFEQVSILVSTTARSINRFEGMPMASEAISRQTHSRNTQAISRNGHFTVRTRPLRAL